MAFDEETLRKYEEELEKIPYMPLPDDDDL
jgi:hypothetical protein